MSFVKSFKWLFGCDETDQFDAPDRLIIHPFGNNFETDELNNVVVVKGQTLEGNKIKTYKPKEGEDKFLYEPKILEQYIGQDQAKEQIKTAIKIIRQLRPVHIMINGWAGCGKTALAKITANMLNANFIYRVPEQLDDVDKLLKVINDIQSTERLTVFMLDEIHTINKFPRVANVLLPILQDWKYGNVDIRPFVMIGATTNKDYLVKKQAPLVSRFQIQITLDKYDPSELQTIIKNYKDSLYREHDLNDEDYKIIARNSRGIPREAISLMLKQLVVKDISKVLQQSDIIGNGLRGIDLKVLKALAEQEKPMGANYLSQIVGIPQADYEQIYERFLIEEGYIARHARGRSIRDKGKILLKQLERFGK